MTEWLNVRFVSYRVLGVVAIGLAAACTATPSDDAVSSEDSTLAVGDVSYIGDEGPGWDAREVDPTRAPGFSAAALERRIADAPTKLQLTFTWKGQETGYWCGPGSTRMALSTRMTADKLPSQTDLATFMGTTTDGTARADVVRALNNWLTPDSPYQSIPVDNVPTDDQRTLIKATLISRLSAGYPVIANVLSGWRPPGYPSGTIGHFVAVVGYDASTDTVMIADPAGAGAPGPRWVNVPQSYWISLQNFGTWVGGRGIAG